MMALSRFSIIVCLHFLSLTAYTQKKDSVSFAPVLQTTADQEHRRMMQQLGITSVRPGASGNPQSPNAANSDESKATNYTSLPDPLLLKNGQRAASAKDWWKKRRPEIVEDFDREVYGRLPKNIPKVQWKVISTKSDSVGKYPVTVKKLVGQIRDRSFPYITVDIDLTLTTPARSGKPVPIVMEFSFIFPSGFRPPANPREPPITYKPWQEQVLEKGWGYAILIPTSVQPDNGSCLTEGIIGLVNKGQSRKPDDWGALRAWAWTASRAMDYFETDKSVDAKKVVIEGLSRYGKAAAVTMAYDERFAIGFIASSGAGGLKLHRRDFGEKVENVAGPGEFHWMAGNYIKYAGPLTANDLPVDAHELVALCAPRPIFISAGAPDVEGTWIDAKGTFLAGVYGGPVYKLLGKKDLGTNDFPPIETALTDGDIAFRQHRGGHTAGPNWETFLRFAERYFR